ncbi:hypothetical protein U1Q18_049811 [Sarracenia purpurea var. burkii]
MFCKPDENQNLEFYSISGEKVEDASEKLRAPQIFESKISTKITFYRSYNLCICGRGLVPSAAAKRGGGKDDGIDKERSCFEGIICKCDRIELPVCFAASSIGLGYCRSGDD